MARNKNDFLARKILLGVMAATVLYGGAFVSLAEAEETGDIAYGKATADGSTEACNVSKTETSGSWTPKDAVGNVFTAGLVDGYVANASNDTLILDKSVNFLRNEPKDSHYVIASGYVKNGAGDANNNTLKILGMMSGESTGTFDVRYIYAGYSENGSANGNTVDIRDGIYSNSTKTGELLYGGYGKTYANNNTVNIGGGSFRASSIYGGYGHQEADGNNVVINGGMYEYPALIYGGSSATDGKATNNTVTVIDGTFNNGVAIRGGSVVNGNANGNIVTIKKGNINEVTGGSVGLVYEHDDCSANNNKVIIEGGTISGIVYGGFCFKGEANENTVIISGGIVKNQVYGGCAQDNGTASGNSVIINGGTVEKDVLAGYAKGNNPVADNNSITLGNADDKDGVANVKGNVIPRWTINTSTLVSERFGGTINVYNLGNKISGVGNSLYAGEGNLNFFINSEDMNQAGSNTMLTVEDTAYISGTTVNAGVRNAGSIKKDDKITLLSAGTIKGEAASYNNMTASDGIMEAELEIVKDENKIIATALQDAKAAPKEESAAKSPVETMAASISLLNSGSDMMAGESMSRAAEAANGSGMSPFASIGGSSLKIKSGSHVDMKSWNINVGLAKEVENKNGKLLFGPVIEYGRGSYDSYLDNGAHGNGKSSFYGIGMIAKQSYNNGVYIDGSIRLGKAKSDYSSTAIGGGVNYDTSATYYAMHTGVGKIVDINEKDSIDYYGKLFYSHQNGSSTQVGAYTYDFKAVDSFRTRLGFRYNHKLTEANSLYAGLAWQHEFSSKCEATIHNGGNSMEAPAPSVKGDSGIIELGWKMNPAENSRFEMDLGLTGHVGKQQGVGANVNFLWHF